MAKWYAVCLAVLTVQVSAVVTLNVLSPSSLSAVFPGGIPGMPALFGTLPYGSYVAGKLLSTGTSCCYSCVPLNFNASIPSIFLIPYGTCPPDAKVYSAQQAGAKAVLLYNSVSRLHFDAMTPEGSHAISIPSMLVGPKTYMQIAQTDGDIYLNMTFELGHVTEPLSIGMGFALIGDLDYQLAVLLPVLTTFDMAVVSYTPYYLIEDCSDCWLPPNFPDCMLKGKYCSLDHKKGGALRLQEVIRQTCIYQASLNQSSYSLYVNYMEVWFSKCLPYPDQICTAGYEAAGVNATDIQACYNASFLYSSNSLQPYDNAYLRTLQSAIYSMSNVTLLPSVTLGNEMVYGDLSNETWTRAICSAMGNKSHPACSKYFCAPGCWVDMLSNGLCDLSCNLKECKFDNNACITPLLLPPPAEPRPPSDPHSNNTSSYGNSTVTPLGNSTSSSSPTGSSNATLPLGNSTYSDNSTSIPSNVTVSGNTPTATNHSRPWECSMGCDQLAFSSLTCHSACNVSDCNYQNWTCACAPGCSPALLANDLCDNVCNTQSCAFDDGYCSRITVPLVFFPVPLSDSHRDTVEMPAWKKWIIISFSVLGFRYSLSSFICVGVILCFRKMRGKQRHAQYSRDDPSLNQLNQSVVPISDGIEVLNADKIMSALGGRLFVPEILEFADAICVVCLSE